LIWEKQERQ